MRRTAPVDEMIVISRPVSDVYGFYTDMRNMPRFLGDVLHVQVRSAERARWTVALPLGLRIRWTTEVTSHEPDRHYAFRVRFLWTATHWDLEFHKVDEQSTVVREQLSFPGGRFGLTILALVGKHPGAEVRANLHRLQQVLETGQATDSAATMGKHFGDDG